MVATDVLRPYFRHGKILNVERARLDKMLGSGASQNLVLAMGAAIGDTFRYWQSCVIIKSSSQQMPTWTDLTCIHPFNFSTGITNR